MSVLAASTSMSHNLGFGARRTENKAAGSKLNLVSLMDIFTILVFFLMMNTGDVEVLQPDEAIALPKSVTTVKPSLAPVVKVNNQAIYFKETLIASAEDFYSRSNGNDTDIIKSLYDKLLLEKASLAERRGVVAADNAAANMAGDAKGLPISVMGDASVPYTLLKRVLTTCAQAGFRDVSMAVEHTSAVSAEKAGSPS